jgi:hypothetical protein
MGETLYPLSTALGLTGLLDYERELLVLVQMSAPLIISGVVFQIGTLVLPPFMPSSV